MNNDVNDLYETLIIDYMKLNKMRLMIFSNKIFVDDYDIKILKEIAIVIVRYNLFFK